MFVIILLNPLTFPLTLPTSYSICVCSHKWDAHVTAHTQTHNHATTVSCQYCKMTTWGGTMLIYIIRHQDMTLTYSELISPLWEISHCSVHYILTLGGVSSSLNFLLNRSTGIVNNKRRVVLKPVTVQHSDFSWLTGLLKPHISFIWSFIFIHFPFWRNPPHFARLVTSTQSALACATSTEGCYSTQLGVQCLIWGIWASDIGPCGLPTPIYKQSYTAKVEVLKFHK